MPASIEPLLEEVELLLLEEDAELLLLDDADEALLLEEDAELLLVDVDEDEVLEEVLVDELVDVELELEPPPAPVLLPGMHDGFVEIAGGGGQQMSDCPFRYDFDRQMRFALVSQSASPFWRSQRSPSPWRLQPKAKSSATSTAPIVPKTQAFLSDSTRLL